MLQRGERARCQAKRTIRGHQGLVSADDRGTIEGEIDNLGRHMFAVRWDNGLSMYVFPDEIMVEDEMDSARYTSQESPIELSDELYAAGWTAFRQVVK